jgi:hypothetical protein
MSTSSTTRRFATKAIRNVAAAIVTAGVASAALAAPASASPLDMFSLDAGTTQLGTNCVGPLGDAQLDWRENLAAGTVRPLVTGDICLHNTNRQARVVLEYRGQATFCSRGFAAAPCRGGQAGWPPSPSVSAAIRSTVRS